MFRYIQFFNTYLQTKEERANFSADEAFASREVELLSEAVLKLRRTQLLLGGSHDKMKKRFQQLLAKRSQR